MSQCVQNLTTNPQGDFYDGGQMEAGLDGEIYAAWVNKDKRQVDIYMSGGAGSQFNPMPPPFPPNSVNDHPLLRYSPEDASLYVLAPIGVNGGTALFINRWDGSQWTGAIQATDPDSSSELAINFSPSSGVFHPVRRGRTYSFDVGPSSGTVTSPGPSVLRLLYNVQPIDTNGVAQRAFLRGRQCDPALTNCIDEPGWGTGANNTSHAVGDQYSPLVRLARPTSFSGGTYQWKSSWSSREDDPSGDTFIIVQGDMTMIPAPGGGTMGFTLGEPVFGPLTPCPSVQPSANVQSNNGYWGDYDDLQTIGWGVGTGSAPGVATWIQTFSDSSQGCQFNWAWTSYQLHISNVVYQ